MPSNEERLALLMEALEYAAEKVGDITQPTLERFYTKNPQAKETFAYHGLGDVDSLEATMVESALYCLMNWLENPKEVEILILETLPHHIDTLDIPRHLFQDLLDASINIVKDALPDEMASQRQVMTEIRSDLQNLVTTA